MSVFDNSVPSLGESPSGPEPGANLKDFDAPEGDQPDNNGHNPVVEQVAEFKEMTPGEAAVANSDMPRQGGSSWLVGVEGYDDEGRKLNNHNGTRHLHYCTMTVGVPWTNCGQQWGTFACECGHTTDHKIKGGAA